MTQESLDFDWTEEDRPAKKSRSKVVITLVVILVLLLATVGGFALWALGKFNSIEKFDAFQGIDKIEGSDSRPTHDPGDDTPPVNFLVLGSDSRISAGNPDEWKAGAQRTDVMMLVQVSGNRESVNVMSIPRDSWVNIPGVGEAKINAAFSYGGPALTIATVEQLTGVPIDHMAIVDFTSFVNLTDTVGGVEIQTNAGTQRFNGEEALKFVRERYSLPGGDLDRVRRQQAWMLAVMSKVMTRETLSSPSKVLELFDSVSPYMSVDDELSSTEVVSLATSLKDIRSNDINLMTAPIAGPDRSADGQSILRIDQEAFDALSLAFAEDRVDNYVATTPELQTIRDGNIR